MIALRQCASWVRGVAAAMGLIYCFGCGDIDALEKGNFRGLVEDTTVQSSEDLDPVASTRAKGEDDLALTPIPPRENTYYSWVNKATGHCMTIANNRTFRGARVEVTPCTGADAQRFRMRDYRDGSFDVLGDVSRLCLGPMRKVMRAGAVITQSPCLSTESQRLTYKVAQDGYAAVAFLETSLCIGTAPHASGRVWLRTQPCDGSDAQLWQVRLLQYGERWPVESLP